MKNIVVIGSSGAIGKAFIESYIKDSNIESIFSFSRSGYRLRIRSFKISLLILKMRRASMMQQAK